MKLKISKPGLNGSAARGKLILRPGQALAQAFQRALDFNGRSRRSAYWWFALFTTLGSVAVALLEDLWPVSGSMNGSILSILFLVIVVLPDLSLGVRRLHDTGRRGWPYVIWVVVSYGLFFVPEPRMEDYNPEADIMTPAHIFGYVDFYLLVSIGIYVLMMMVMIFLLTRDSQVGQNAYGPNRKDVGNPDIFS